MNQRKSWSEVTGSKGALWDFYFFLAQGVQFFLGFILAKEEVKYLPEFKRHALLALKVYKRQ